jgi:TatD DNase family protein
MRLVDSHCHLPLISPDISSIKDIVLRASEVGVEHMLCVSVDLESFPTVLATAEKYQSVSASVGVHPNTVGKVVDPTVEQILNHCDSQVVVAVGETGLDYYRNDETPESQKARFRNHITAAKECGKPLIIHCRDAAKDLIEILRSEQAEQVGGVMHCFVEDWETAKAAIDLGFYISFSGIVTFKNAIELKEVAKRVPTNKILVETDSPWLAPVPERGKQNEPAFVHHTAQYLAELRNCDLEEFGEVTSENFYRLFPLAKAQRLKKP